MSIHLIGIGEPIMGNLAIALCKQGHTVTGSDEHFDNIVIQRLRSAGLVPERFGWFSGKIQKRLDKVIVGRMIRLDNPELQAARRLGMAVYSYPEYVYEYAKDKQRIVITEVQKSTLICMLVLHVLRYLKKEIDYVFESTALSAGVQLCDAPAIILEGDGAPSSALDFVPKSLRYQHNIALIGPTDWQASDAYPTLEAYLHYITRLADASPKGGVLIFCGEDKHIKHIGNKPRTDVKNECYKNHSHRQRGGQTYLVTPQGDVLFPYHNLASMGTVSAARQLVQQLAVTDHQFYEAIAAFC